MYMIVVQVGTNNGNDHVRRFCLEHKPSKIVLVEPIRSFEKEIRKNYSRFSNVSVEFIAITPGNEESVTLYYHIMDGPVGHPSKHYEVTSMRADHVLKHGYTREGLAGVVCPAMNMNTFLETRGLTTVDYMFLDIEGVDFEVLKSIDLGRFDVRYLQIEHAHLNRPELIEYMKGWGYEAMDGVFDDRGLDTRFRKVSS